MRLTELMHSWYHSTAPNADTILRLGSRGPAVEAWQRFLIAQDLPNVGSADGHFGPLTQAATVLFQRAQALVPGGVVGPKTRARDRSAAICAVLGSAATHAKPGAHRLYYLASSAALVRARAQAYRAASPFESAERQLVGKLEWHYDERRGKHKGLSVFVVG